MRASRAKTAPQGRFFFKTPPNQWIERKINRKTDIRNTAETGWSHFGVPIFGGATALTPPYGTCIAQDNTKISRCRCNFQKPATLHPIDDFWKFFRRLNQNCKRNSICKQFTNLRAEEAMQWAMLYRIIENLPRSKILKTGFAILPHANRKWLIG